MSGKLQGSRIQLVFMGYGKLQDSIAETASSSENVHFQPAVPYQEMLQYTKDADVGLVSVRPICLSYLYCLPNKLFECIQAGVPVLVNDLPDCVALIDTYGIGRVVKGDEPQSWLEALMAMAGETPTFKAQVKDGLARAQSQLNWEREQHVLIGVYARVRSCRLPSGLRIYPPIERSTAFTSRSVPRTASMLSIQRRASVRFPSAANISAV